MIHLTLLLALTATKGSNDDRLIKAAYTEQINGINTLNPKRFAATLDPSFTQVGQTGKVLDYHQYVTEITGMLKIFKSATLKSKLGPIKYSQKTATVDYTIEGDLVGPKTSLHLVEKGQDTWKKSGKTYLQTHEVIHSLTTSPKK
jgi:hypothetical protein